MFKHVISLQDIISIVVLSLPCGWICNLMGLPMMFGYIICGVLLGPSGLNHIKVLSCSDAFSSHLGYLQTRIFFLMYLAL